MWGDDALSVKRLQSNQEATRESNCYRSNLAGGERGRKYFLQVHPAVSGGCRIPAWNGCQVPDPRLEWLWQRSVTERSRKAVAV